MKDRSTIWFLSVAFIIPAMAFAFFMWYEKKMSALPVLGEKDHKVTGFQLKDQDNRIFIYEPSEKIMVAGFFFTHCPSICPAIIKNLKKVNEKILNEKNIQLLSITVDPERDSASQLKNYCLTRKINNDHWEFLTGDKKTIYKLARNSFKVVATDGDGGPEDFIHSEKLVLVDRKGRIRGYYNGTSSNETDQLIADIKKLQDEN